MTDKQHMFYSVELIKELFEILLYFDSTSVCVASHVIGLSCGLSMSNDGYDDWHFEYLWLHYLYFHTKKEFLLTTNMSSVGELPVYIWWNLKQSTSNISFDSVKRLKILLIKIIERQSNVPAEIKNVRCFFL